MTKERLLKTRMKTRPTMTPLPLLLLTHLLQIKHHADLMKQQQEQAAEKEQAAADPADGQEEAKPKESEQGGQNTDKPKPKQKRKLPPLTRERIQKLNDIGFIFEPRKEKHTPPTQLKDSPFHTSNLTRYSQRKLSAASRSDGVKLARKRRRKQQEGQR